MPLSPKTPLSLGLSSVMTLGTKKMFQIKLQKGMVLIVPEHQPSAGNVPGSLAYPLCHLGGGQDWSVLCRRRWTALSVYISASTETWPALRLELDTYYLTYLPLLSLTLTKGDRALYSLSSLAARTCPEWPLAYTVVRSPTVMAMWWIQRIKICI